MMNLEKPSKYIALMIRSLSIKQASFGYTVPFITNSTENLKIEKKEIAKSDKIIILADCEASKVGLCPDHNNGHNPIFGVITGNNPSHLSRFSIKRIGSENFLDHFAIYQETEDMTDDIKTGSMCYSIYPENIINYNPLNKQLPCITLFFSYTSIYTLFLMICNLPKHTTHTLKVANIVHHLKCTIPNITVFSSKASVTLKSTTYLTQVMQYCHKIPIYYLQKYEAPSLSVLPEIIQINSEIKKFKKRKNISLFFILLSVLALISIILIYYITHISVTLSTILFFCLGFVILFLMITCIVLNSIKNNNIKYIASKITAPTNDHLQLYTEPDDTMKLKSIYDHLIYN